MSNFTEEYMMSWNWRMFKHEGDKENLIFISEAYYTDGILEGYVDPKVIFDKGLFEEDLESLKQTFQYFIRATESPIVLIKKDGELVEEV